MERKNDIPTYVPFNPLDKRHLGESAANALLSSEICALPPNPFLGAGVYALYYTGDFPSYHTLAAANRDNQFACPIYVGKAVPAGARKGGIGMDVDHGLALHKRLSEHADSITDAQNLTLSDFYCRFLVVDDIWIPLTESLLIERFKPVWNRALEGFGNHDPGKGRYNGKMPAWDCLHPGRAWAERLQPCALSAQDLHTRLSLYFPP
ncbi:MAG: Eco29kI family restriction endonuclease [Evtepia sp.]